MRRTPGPTHRENIACASRNLARASHKPYRRFAQTLPALRANVGRTPLARGSARRTWIRIGWYERAISLGLGQELNCIDRIAQERKRGQAAQ